MSAQKLIFNTDAPLKNAKRYVPLYMGLAGFIMALVTIKKGLKHVGVDLGAAEGYALAIAVAVVVAIIGKIAISRLNIDPKADKQMQFNNVEKVFAVLMVLTACCMAFAHGSNDVANAIGPLAAVVNIVEKYSNRKINIINIVFEISSNFILKYTSPGILVRGFFRITRNFMGRFPREPDPSGIRSLV